MKSFQNVLQQSESCSEKKFKVAIGVDWSVLKVNMVEHKSLKWWRKFYKKVFSVVGSLRTALKLPLTSHDPNHHS